MGLDLLFGLGVPIPRCRLLALQVLLFALELGDFCRGIGIRGPRRLEILVLLVENRLRRLQLLAQVCHLLLLFLKELVVIPGFL